MQKKFIALAVAGLVSGAAFAQSNVTIYGVADASFDNVVANGGSQNATGNLLNVSQPGLNRVNSNSSYIGFKGTEALGNGLSAVFQIESQVAIDGSAGTTGTGNSFANRDTFVGLTGGFGTVTMGIVTPAYRGALAAMDPTPGATGPGAGAMNIAGKALTTVGSTASAANAANLNVGVLTTTAARHANSIAYVSPSFSGLVAKVSYSANVGGAAEAKTLNPTPFSVNNTAWNLGLNYDNGPIKAVFAYQEQRDFSPGAAGTGFGSDLTGNAAGDTGLLAVNARSNSHKIRSWILGGAYTFNNATTVGLAYDENKAMAGDDSTAGGSVAAVAAGNTRINDTKLKTWLLSVKHVMGAHEIAGVYGQTRSNVSTTSGAGALAITGLDQQGSNAFSLRYGYNLSKRTQAYAYYSQINNERNGVNNFTVGTQAAGGGADPRAIGGGIRHSF